jgi:hypothetical protein
MEVVQRVKPIELPPEMAFKWERDYAPHWEPGSTAFWLEPETHQQLANWFATYRPDVTGFVEAAGLRIEIVPAPPIRKCVSCGALEGDRGLVFFGPHCARCDAGAGLQLQLSPLAQLQNAQLNGFYNAQSNNLRDYYNRRLKLPGGLF